MSWSTSNSLDTAFFSSNTMAASPGPASQPSSRSLLQHHSCLPCPLFWARPNCWIITIKILNLLQYLDGFLTVGPLEAPVCALYLQNTFDVCEHLGLLRHTAKRAGPWALGILGHLDNEAVVHILNPRASRTPSLMQLLGHFMLSAFQVSIYIKLLKPFLVSDFADWLHSAALAKAIQYLLSF